MTGILSKFLMGVVTGIKIMLTTIHFDSRKNKKKCYSTTFIWHHIDKFTHSKSKLHITFQTGSHVQIHHIARESRLQQVLHAN
jgi:hypothetical protein